jgi:hypothetical protein
VSIKISDSRPQKRIAPAQASQQYKWQQDTLLQENENQPNFSNIAGPISKSQTMKESFSAMLEQRYVIKFLVKE